MKVTVLVDNNPHPTDALLIEHGLSFYFEYDGFKWLFDCGASDSFHTNACKLGIKIEDVDFLILSHGHSDHTGGVEHFIKVNNKAKILMSARVSGQQYFSYRQSGRRNISIDQLIIKENINRFILLEKNLAITQNVNLVCGFPMIYETPKANTKLFRSDNKSEKPDNFDHEVVLTVNTTNGLVVFSGCSHNGILNILEASSVFHRQAKIIACIGGTHLVESNQLYPFESEDEINRIGEKICMLYPGMKLITGHCTGKPAQNCLSKTLGKNFMTFHSGFMVEI